MGFQLPADDPGAARGVVIPEHDVSVLAVYTGEDVVKFRGHCLCGVWTHLAGTKAAAEKLGVVHLREMRTKREAS